MTLDRTGEPITEHRCRNGWLTPADSDSPRLRPICRPQKRRDLHDYAERTPSARAAEAIARADREDRR